MHEYNIVTLCLGSKTGMLANQGAELAHSFGCFETVKLLYSFSLFKFYILLR